MTPNDRPLIEAAGGVVWRVAGNLEFAIVHRPRHDDWSLPKGKLEPGELPVCAAVREILEETGLHVVPGRRLLDLRYEVPAGPKRVRYWSMRMTGGVFAPNDEVDTLRWITPDMARAILGQGQGHIVEDFVAGHALTRATPVFVGGDYDEIAAAYGVSRILDADSAATVLGASADEAARVRVADWPGIAAELGAPGPVRTDAAAGAWALHRRVDDGSVLEVERLPTKPAHPPRSPHP